MNPHGKIEFCWHGEVLFIYSYGPFNEEGITEAITELRQAVIEKNIHRWSRVEVLDEESLGSPQTVKLLKQSYQWFDDHGCRHTAVVAETSLLKQLLRTTITQKIEFFDSQEQALQWLAKSEDKI